MRCYCCVYQKQTRQAERKVWVKTVKTHCSSCWTEALDSSVSSSVQPDLLPLTALLPGSLQEHLEGSNSTSHASSMCTAFPESVLQPRLCNTFCAEALLVKRIKSLFISMQYFWCQILLMSIKRHLREAPIVPVTSHWITKMSLTISKSYNQELFQTFCLDDDSSDIDHVASSLILFMGKTMFPESPLLSVPPSAPRPMLISLQPSEQRSDISNL